MNSIIKKRFWNYSIYCNEQLKKYGNQAYCWIIVCLSRTDQPKILKLMLTRMVNEKILLKKEKDSIQNHLNTSSWRMCKNFIGIQCRFEFR